MAEVTTAPSLAPTVNGTIDPCSAEALAETTTADLLYSVSINILVFFTVWGISTVVDFDEFKQSFRKPPIYAGVAFQFLLMPLIGFITVTIFPLDPFEAVALLILCASPGGSFSNWWCNLFNADLALSVSMTSLSTVASVGMLPLNILLYITVAYQRTQEFDGDEIEIDFADLGITLGIVIAAIISGLYTGYKWPRHQLKYNLVGNFAGGASIILGVFASADTCDGVPPWQQPFYPLWVGTAFPLLAALGGTLILGGCLGLPKPKRVAISLETAYQNSSIALAYTLSQGAAGRRAAAVPVIYGGYEAGFFFLFMVGSWQLGWTFAPAKENVIKVMFDNYQPGSANYRKLHPEEYPEEEGDGEIKEGGEEIQEAVVVEEVVEAEKAVASANPGEVLVEDEKTDADDGGATSKDSTEDDIEAAAAPLKETVSDTAAEEKGPKVEPAEGMAGKDGETDIKSRGGSVSL